MLLKRPARPHVSWQFEFPRPLNRKLSFHTETCHIIGSMHLISYSNNSVWSCLMGMILKKSWSKLRVLGQSWDFITLLVGLGKCPMPLTIGIGPSEAQSCSTACLFIDPCVLCSASLLLIRNVHCPSDLSSYLPIALRNELQALKGPIFMWWSVMPTVFLPLLFFLSISNLEGCKFRQMTGWEGEKKGLLCLSGAFCPTKGWDISAFFPFWMKM